MFSFRRPTSSAVDAFLETERTLELTYSARGATRELGAPGVELSVGSFTVDHHRAALGCGEEVFGAACRAMDAWQSFGHPWVELHDGGRSPFEGHVVGVLIHALGLWSLNSARVVYTLDEEWHGRRRFGFAYGTLPGHAECGEERFAVEWDIESDEVTYDLIAFSRPRHPLARLAYPYTRWLQGRFARESLACVRQFVEDQLAGLSSANVKTATGSS